MENKKKQKLKVWGGLLFNHDGKQEWVIIAATSAKKAHAGIVDQSRGILSRYCFNHYFYETGNERDIQLATQAPGSLIWTGAPFKFQYKIGPYKADFLIGESLVFEIDGPHHSEPDQKAHDRRRDVFIREFGYRIMRVPAWVAAVEPDAVIEELKGVMDDEK